MKQRVKDIIKKTPLFQPLKEVKITYMNIFPQKTISKKYNQFYGRKLDWKNPQYLSEKMQVLKWDIYPKDTKLVKAADKYTIHEYLESIGLSDFATPFIDVYDNSEQYSSRLLPKSFVLKQTNSSGNIIIVKDKDDIEEEFIKKEISKWFTNDYGRECLEPHYSKACNRVICEPYFENLGDEYRIFMVNGKIGYIQLIIWNWNESVNYKSKNPDIIMGHGKHDRIYCDENFNILWKDKDLITTSKVKIPEEWNKLVQISKKIANDFPVVRVDFNKINNEFKITELTFTPANCYLEILKEIPDLDLALGSIPPNEEYL